jgi:transcriptional regulator with PAS, ATPase and Fis domain
MTQLGDMVARSLVMQRLFSRLRQSAPHLRIVALEGEAGTGKGRWRHRTTDILDSGFRLLASEF